MKSMKFEHTETYGWEAAVRGARAPLQSWDKSDSGYCTADDFEMFGCQGCQFEDWCGENGHFQLGPADHELLLKLAKPGPEHGKFLRMIHITVDITAPVFFLRELDTYKVGTVCNSTSFQHTGKDEAFSPYGEQFSMEDVFNALSLKYPDNREGIVESLTHTIFDYFRIMNTLMDTYNETKDYTFFRAVRELLPMSYNYTITWDANYAVLRTIYHQRKNHRLSEWSGETGSFCAWVKSLPFAELITEV